MSGYPISNFGIDRIVPFLGEDGYRFHIALANGREFVAKPRELDSFHAFRTAVLRETGRPLLSYVRDAGARAESFFRLAVEHFFHPPRRVADKKTSTPRRA